MSDARTFLTEQAGHATAALVARADCLEQLRDMLKRIASPGCVDFTVNKVASVIDTLNLFGSATTALRCDAAVAQASAEFFSPMIHGLLVEVAEANAALYVAQNESGEGWPAC